MNVLGKPSDSGKKIYVAEWQWQLSGGDCFLLMGAPGQVIYGIVLPQPQRKKWTRRSRLFERYKKETDRDVDIRAMDLPLTRTQFEMAREMGWPSDIRAIRCITRMAELASA